MRATALIPGQDSGRQFVISPKAHPDVVLCLSFNTVIGVEISPFDRISEALRDRIDFFQQDEMTSVKYCRTNSVYDPDRSADFVRVFLTCVWFLASDESVELSLFVFYGADLQTDKRIEQLPCPS